MKTKYPTLLARSLQTLILLSLPILGTPLSAAGNQLAHHPSPYLALHGQDPVHWQAWSEEVLKQARAENKLILVSIGYFSCHWCHVMQRESYQDADVAKLLNQSFISVKVDRELRPALDQTLIDFVEATRGHAGWPLNVFLTPEGFPLFGETYMPKANFLDVLKQLNDRWQAEDKNLASLAQAALSQWLPESKPETLGKGEGILLEQAFVDQALQASDTVAGGFGNQNKFPSSPQLNALLDAHERTPSQQIEAFVGYTLFMMASQGLRDQIGGGFFRYTVDPTWQVPHFEKMLYNNAQLPSLYLRAAKALKQPSLAAVALDTLDFVERELAHKNGGYIASLSAVDDKDVEGGYYLWFPEDIRDLLNDDEYRIIEMAWKLKEPSSFDDGHLPIQGDEIKEIAKALNKPVKEIIRVSQTAREKIFKARQSRVVPADDKRITAWNALLLSAFVDAAEHGEARFAESARKLRDFLVKRMVRDDRLIRSLDGDKPLGKAGLEDYAYTVQALWKFAQWSKSGADADLAARLADTAWQLFHSDKGWRLTDASLLPFSVDEPLVADGPMSSPAAVLTDTTLKMSRSGQDKLARPSIDQALVSLYRSYERLKDEPYFHATQIMALSRHEATK